ncbi:gamma-glutamylcysteine synthetase [Salmonella enterica subsp. enterica]|uniref:Glutamate--cysteine ligase n=1 Tax=Salmonella enterica I TaxID=59201 RepID=A0A447N553_SALET|nr:gamma-glutamylcysteine synthetase [Salmonella enterica subsp. enterica]
MIPDVSQALAWLEKHPQALKGIQRGLERETLRVNADGTLATTGHPEALGSALTHKWITTDFAEALLEFITPVDGDIQHMLTFMRDLHRYTARKLGDERMWPLSMPCYIAEGQDIELAQYGTSNTGRFKTLYREGLKNRYGALMQTISGVHYNFFITDGVLAGEMRRYGRRSGKRKNFCRLFSSDSQLLPFWLGHPLSVWRVSGHLFLFPAREANHITV